MKEAVKITAIVFGSSLLFVIVGVIVLVLIIRNLAQDGSQKNKTTEQAVSSDNYLRGVSFSPKGSQVSDLLDFYTQATRVANTITWAGKWDELVEKGAPYNISKTAKDKGFTPLVLVGTHNGSISLISNRTLNTETKEIYKNAAVAYVGEFKPPYFIMGIEINRIYDQDPGGFDFFADLFAETVMEIKKSSPNTKAGTVFQLEQIKGLKGGLFGGLNNETNNQWTLLERFPAADVIGFTTYPGLIYKDPSEIPTEYYSEIATKTNKPVIFTEVGWSSGDDSIPGWESTEAEQEQFVTRFFDLTKSLDPKVLIWPLLYDNNFGQPFNNMGLINEDGVEKLAFKIWQTKFSN